MRAARLAAPGEISLDEVALPEPGPGQVRIRLEGCGVCASNLTPWGGAEWMTYPTEPGALGHEGWGVVDAVGEGVTEFFFFQAEDGIRDLTVTGVQTCALPI